MLKLISGCRSLTSSWLSTEAQQVYKGKCRAQWKCTKQAQVRRTARTGSMALLLTLTPPPSEKATNKFSSKAKVLPAFEFHFVIWKIREHPFADDASITQLAYELCYFLIHCCMLFFPSDYLYCTHQSRAKGHTGTSTCDRLEEYHCGHDLAF